MNNVLKCPVCAESLIRKENTYVCTKNHSYDISRRGYVNLLLANQKHSDNSGDSKEMIFARENFLKTGKYNCLKEELVRIIEKYVTQKHVIFGDMACGEGYYTKFIHDSLKRDKEVETYGVDLSKAGIVECSKKVTKKETDIHFVIGNLMFLPFLDNSFDVLLNCFAKIKEDEFCRVLKTGGIYIRVLPASNHLLQMKEILYEHVNLNEEKIEEIENFELIEKKIVEDKISLNNDEIRNLFMMTPYYYKTSKEASLKLENMECLNTIISFNILIYKKK